MVEKTDQVAVLMIIFGAGYIAVSESLRFYWHAYRPVHCLGLNELEVFDTPKTFRRVPSKRRLGTVSITAWRWWAEADSQVGGNDLHALPSF